jgi:hypothetical protein
MVRYFNEFFVFAVDLDQDLISFTPCSKVLSFMQSVQVALKLNSETVQISTVWFSQLQFFQYPFLCDA